MLPSLLVCCPPLHNFRDGITPDATVTALQKDLVIQQDQKAQTDNRFAFVTDVVAPIGTAVAVGTLLYTIVRGQIDQRAQEKQRRTDRIEDQGKRDEARFQEAVLALGNKDTKFGAVTTLRTFLQEEGKGYERFYKQIFDLTVGFLQNRVLDPNNPKPDAFNRAIIKLFMESFPLARKLAKEKFEKEEKVYNPIYLDASDIKLDGVDFFGLGPIDIMSLGFNLDLSEAWMCYASFKDTKLNFAILNFAILSGAKLIKAKLFNANLSGANLSGADLNKANLSGADLNKANLFMAKLIKAKLFNANLSGANFRDVILTGADLSGADLEGANPEDAEDLQDTKMWDVKNYPDEKLQKCNDRGAIIKPPSSSPDTKGETK